MNTKWTGQTYSLEKFCNQHRSKFVNLEEANNHVDFQLPTAHSRVRYLLDNILHTDADLCAAIANIQMNINNTRNDFENAVSVILPVDPFIKKRQNSNENNNTNGTVASTSTSTDYVKTGTTGVKLQFHSGEQYSKLTAAQKSELHKWRNTPEGQRFTKSEKKKVQKGTCL